MTKTIAKKYLAAIKASKVRHLTCEALSRSIGIYPEIIAENLSYFEPMIALTIGYDLRDLVPQIEKYLKEQETLKSHEKKLTINSKELNEYKSVSDFVYKKMTINGLVSRNIALKEEDLKILKKIVDRELKPKKSKK